MQIFKYPLHVMAEIAELCSRENFSKDMQMLILTECY